MSPKAFIIIFLLVFIATILLFANECFSQTIPSGGSCTCKAPPQKGGLVPCGRQSDDPDTPLNECCRCTLCHFFVLIKKIIDFLTVNIAFPLLALMITAGGIMYLISGGDPKRLNTAKTILKNAAIGVLIVLCAWVIVDTLITFLTPADSPFQNWSTIQCPTSQ